MSWDCASWPSYTAFHVCSQTLCAGTNCSDSALCSYPCFWTPHQSLFLHQIAPSKTALSVCWLCCLHSSCSLASQCRTNLDSSSHFCFWTTGLTACSNPPKICVHLPMDGMCTVYAPPLTRTYLPLSSTILVSPKISNSLNTTPQTHYSSPV